VAINSYYCRRFVVNTALISREAIKSTLDRRKTGAIRSWDIERVEFVDIRNSEFILKALKVPFMSGTIAILHGEEMNASVA
jgi:hypothetical protein